MKLKIILLSVLCFSPALAFEINTHQAITNCALSMNCSQQGAENLNYFALTMQLNGVNYDDQFFEGYNKKYFKYAIEGKGLGDTSEDDIGKLIDFTKGQTYLKGATDKDGNITNLIDYSKNSYISLIEAGSILEDALYHNHVMDGDGRYNNHLYSVQYPYPINLPYKGKTPSIITFPVVELINSFRLTDHTYLADGPMDAFPGKRTDAISWALQKDVDLGQGRTNEYNLHKAFEYYRESFKGTYNKRKRFQAKLFVSLGHVLHLLEDMHSPAHVRNGPHAGGDYLEIYGRHDGGFLLRNGALASTNESEITEAVKNIDIKDIMLEKIQYQAYQDFFVGEALWVSQNFFSEAHALDLTEEHDFITGEGVELEDDWCGTRATTIFDKRNASPSPSQTYTKEKEVNPWNYIISNGNASTLIKGDIPEQTVLGFQQKISFLWINRCKSMSPRNKPLDWSLSYNDFDKTALKDTAKNVIPRAVASVQAFTNFFFRGRMIADLSFDSEYIIIENVSDFDLVSNSNSLAFKADKDPATHKSFKLYYIKDDGESVLVDEFPLYRDIRPASTVAVPTNQHKYAIHIGLILKEKGYEVKVGENNRLILLFDGNIGDDEPEKRADYDLGTTGLSATYVKKSMVKKTGQTIIAVKGDDGTYQKGLPSYFVRNPLSDPDDISSPFINNTVHDVTTGLLWQDNADVATTTKVWHIFDDASDTYLTSGDTALSYCSNLVLSGYSDWRLPNIYELQSMTADRTKYFPAIDTTAFYYYPAIDERNETWSSTVLANLHLPSSDPMPKVMEMNFGLNYVPYDFYKKPLQERHIRCVRDYSDSSPSSINLNEERFTASGNTVVDTKTTLTWELENFKGSFTWNEAINYCNSLPPKGAGWRLPNINEINTITKHHGDMKESLSSLPSVFNDSFDKYPPSAAIGSASFWTSTTTPDNPNSAYAIDHLSADLSFTRHPGRFSGLSKLSDKAKVRCVKGD